MPQVVVTIAGKTYRMACGEGEEAHLAALATQVDGRIAELSQSFAQIGEVGLTVMAAMMVTDELDAAKKRTSELERKLDERSNLSVAIANARKAEREKFAASLDETARSIETIARKLASPASAPASTGQAATPAVEPADRS